MDRAARALEPRREFGPIAAPLRDVADVRQGHGKIASVRKGAEDPAMNDLMLSIEALDADELRTDATATISRHRPAADRHLGRVRRPLPG